MNKSKSDLISKIENALNTVSFGSVEIIVQDKKVTQISVRNIQKTSIEIDNSMEVTTSEKDNTTHTQKIFTIQSRFGRSSD
jgi:hypothetical protein